MILEIDSLNIKNILSREWKIRWELAEARQITVPMMYKGNKIFNSCQAYAGNN